MIGKAWCNWQPLMSVRASSELPNGMANVVRRRQKPAGDVPPKRKLGRVARRKLTGDRGVPLKERAVVMRIAHYEISGREPSAKRCFIR